MDDGSPGFASEAQHKKKKMMIYLGTKIKKVTGKTKAGSGPSTAATPKLGQTLHEAGINKKQTKDIKDKKHRKNTEKHIFKES